MAYPRPDFGGGGGLLTLSPQKSKTKIVHQVARWFPGLAAGKGFTLAALSCSS
jgi:hypothetical protein